jgi:hypothetical protein
VHLSPFPDDVAKVRLRVTVRSPFAEVFLIDHAFAVRESSIGGLNVAVEPGVYKVRARLDDEIVEGLIALRSDQHIDLSDALGVTSSAPIENTTRTHEFHIAVAVGESASVTTEAGSGATLFLMTRRWSTTGSGRDSETRALTKLSLHRMDGEKIVDLEGPQSSDSDPVAGTTVRVDPGAYFLRWRDESGYTVEQSVPTVEGWQTQVFLLEDDDASEGGRQRVSVLMSRDAFEPADPTLRLVEEARSALARERKVAYHFITETLSAKFDNPMLGLFGAHLMLLADEEGQFDQSLFNIVVNNLRGLLGPDHPDVIALSTRATGEIDALPPVSAPPMLWRSWALLIEASNESPAILPVEIWRQTVRLMPERPFLVWSPEDEDPETVSDWEREVADVLTSSKQPNARGPGSTIPNATKQRFSMELLVPRAAIDELAEGGGG